MTPPPHTTTTNTTSTMTTIRIQTKSTMMPSTATISRTLVLILLCHCHWFSFNDPWSLSKEIAIQGNTVWWHVLQRWVAGTGATTVSFVRHGSCCRNRHAHNGHIVSYRTEELQDAMGHKLKEESHRQVVVLPQPRSPTRHAMVAAGGCEQW